MFETVAVANAKAVLHKKSTVRQKDIGIELKRMRDTNIEDDEPDDPLEAARQEAAVRRARARVCVRVCVCPCAHRLVARRCVWRLADGHPFRRRRPRSMRTRGAWTLHCGHGRKLKQWSTVRTGRHECRRHRDSSRTDYCLARRVLHGCEARMSGGTLSNLDAFVPNV